MTEVNEEKLGTSRKPRGPMSDKQKAAISARLKGKPKSDLARIAIGRGIRAYWEERKKLGLKKERNPETIRKFAVTMMNKKRASTDEDSK